MHAHTHTHTHTCARTSIRINTPTHPFTHPHTQTHTPHVPHHAGAARDREDRLIDSRLYDRDRDRESKWGREAGMDGGRYSPRLDGESVCVGYTCVWGGVFGDRWGQGRS